MDNYEDIINLPHYEPKNHPRMSIESRAAQFAPFAALTGYGDLVKETARLTDTRIELDEEEKNIVNNKLQILQSKIKELPQATITYFIPDKKKVGGKYVTTTGNIKKIDEYKGLIILTNKEEIMISEIIEIL